MAEAGSWPSIRKNGLLSTTALLDRFGLKGSARQDIEARRRPDSVVLHTQAMGSATIRDQLPMTDKGLERCLKNGLTPSAWYRVLNSKVFFWFTPDRLQRLLNAGTYRMNEHDVLEVDAAALLSVYEKSAWFCPMNSGCTKPFAHPRGKDTFRRRRKYPYAAWKAVRPRGERVVELAIDYAVPDIAEYVIRVRRMKASTTLRTLFER